MYGDERHVEEDVESYMPYKGTEGGVELIPSDVGSLTTNEEFISGIENPKKTLAVDVSVIYACLFIIAASSFLHSIPTRQR